MRNLAIHLGAASLLAAALAGAAEPAPAFIWWTADSLTKVRPGDPPRLPEGAQLRAARNEFEPFQLVLRAAVALPGVDVEAGDLVADGGARLEAANVTLYRELYVRLPVRSSVEGEAGEWPDPLVPRVDRVFGERRNAFPFALEGGRNQPLWVEVFVPTGTPAGIYRGGLRVSAGERTLAQVPLTLEVWPFTLPSTSSLATSFGFAGHLALRQHRGRYTDDAELYEMTRLYAVVALQHRISLHGGAMVPPLASFSAERAAIDWTQYDREVGPLLDGTAIPEGAPLAGARQTSIDVRTPAEMPDRDTILYWRAWSEHFRERGWHDRLFLYLRDEPQEADYPDVLHRGQLARQADPELRILLTEQPVRALSPVVDLWVPLVNVLEQLGGVEPALAELQAFGRSSGRVARLWWYQSCASHGCNDGGEGTERDWPSYVIDAPALAHRVMPWLAWHNGVEGELYFNTVEAYGMRQDPWRDVFLHGGNGDGTLFYPGPPERIGGRHDLPIESLRLKLIREGLEDYEYLALLARLGERGFAGFWVRSLGPPGLRAERRPDRLLAARAALGERLAVAARRGDLS